MNGVHGIIFSYEKSNSLRELTEPRIPVSYTHLTLPTN